MSFIKGFAVFVFTEKKIVYSFACRVTTDIKMHVNFLAHNYF